MSGSCRPMTCCDGDCALVNGCEIGGIACDSCGLYFCASEIGPDGLCPECAAENDAEEEEAEEEDE